MVQFDSRLRALEGDVHEVLTLPRECEIIQAMKAVGKDYAETAKGQQMPPPHLFVWPEMLRILKKLFPQDTDFIKLLKAHAFEANDNRKLARVVKHCSVSLTEKSKVGVITVTVRASLQPLWDVIRDHLLLIAGAEERFGPPPRGPMIRVFQEMLNQI